MSRPLWVSTLMAKGYEITTGCGGWYGWRLMRSDKVKASVRGFPFMYEGKFGTAYIIGRMAENDEAVTRLALILTETNGEH